MANYTMSNVHSCKYIQGFYELYEKPLRDEIITNIGDTIDESSLYKFLDTYSSDGDINGLNTCFFT